MKSKAFTIVEIIIVMSVVLILSVLAVARFGGFSTIKLNSAANRLSSDIIYARQLSITSQTRYGVRFDIPNNAYTVYNYTTGNPIEDPLNAGQQLIVNFNNIPECKGVSIVGINFGSGSNGVVFDPLGVPLSSTGAVLTSEGTAILTYQTQTRTVYVTPNTGNAGIR